MKRACLVLAALGLVGLVGPAQAQQSSGLLFAFGSGQVVSQTTIDASIQGDLVVAFRGDRAAGCAAYGLCPYSGTIVVRPRSGQLNVVALKNHGRIGHTVFLSLGSPESAYTTSARVTRSVPGGSGGTCADAQSSFLGAENSSVIHAGSVTIRLLAAGGSLLQTRCAGPLDGDLAGVSPAVTLPLARLLHGRIALDLTGTRTFAARGLVGTVTSTLTVKLGTPSKQPANTGFPPGVKTRRVRTVIEHLTLVRVRGALTAAVQGTSDPIVCRLLDSCGVNGTVSLVGGVRQASAAVIATGPASRPYGDFLAALGLSRSGISRGIAVFGEVAWIGDVQSSMSQAGNACTDTAATGGVAVPIGLGAGFGAFAGSWRTRCPGPTFGRGKPVLRASWSPAVLRHREFTIDVSGRGTSTDDGYSIVARGQDSLLLRRGPITQQVTTQPTG